MKKKVIAAVVCGLLITGIAGCGKQAEPHGRATTDSTVLTDMASAIISGADSNSPSEPADMAGAETLKSTEPETMESAEPEINPPAEETESTAAPIQPQPEEEPSAVQTEQPKPEPPAQESEPRQEPQEIPAETTEEPTPPPTQPEAPVQPETPPQEAQPKTAYDFDFDIEAIKADCIGIGQSMGLTLDSSLTPDNASWWNPVTASQSNQGEALKQNLAGYIRFHTAENLSAYGMDGITHFNICCEARGNGVYSIYFLFA